MKNILTILLVILFVRCTSKVFYEDISEELSKQMEIANSTKLKTTLKDVLDVDSADKLYINYSQFNFPNGKWSNQDEFLEDMKLKTINDEDLIFSETSTSIFLIKNNLVFKQYVIQSNRIEVSPEWYSPSIAYLAGVWNSQFNYPNDSIDIYPFEKKMTVFYNSRN